MKYSPEKTLASINIDSLTDHRSSSTPFFYNWPSIPVNTVDPSADEYSMEAIIEASFRYMRSGGDFSFINFSEGEEYGMG